MRSRVEQTICACGVCSKEINEEINCFCCSVCKSRRKLILKDCYLNQHRNLCEDCKEQDETVDDESLEETIRDTLLPPDGSPIPINFKNVGESEEVMYVDTNNNNNRNNKVNNNSSISETTTGFYKPSDSSINSNNSCSYNIEKNDSNHNKSSIKDWFENIKSISNNTNLRTATPVVNINNNLSNDLSIEYNSRNHNINNNSRNSSVDKNLIAYIFGDSRKPLKLDPCESNSCRKDWNCIEAKNEFNRKFEGYRYFYCYDSKSITSECKNIDYWTKQIVICKICYNFEHSKNNKNDISLSQL